MWKRNLGLQALNISEGKRHRRSEVGRGVNTAAKGPPGKEREGSRAINLLGQASMEEVSGHPTGNKGNHQKKNNKRRGKRAKSRNIEFQGEEQAEKPQLEESTQGIR